MTAEPTQLAPHRPVVDAGCEDLILLNFASAKNAGGGFIKGAKDVTRCSGLYLSLPNIFRSESA